MAETTSIFDSVPSNLPKFVRPSSPPKYFGIDFDETFHALKEDGLERNVKAFAQVKKGGYTPFFCTGRSVDHAMGLVGNRFVEKTNYRGYPGVYNTGAVVYDENGNVIYSRSFSKEFIKAVCESVTRRNSPNNLVLFTKDSHYSPIGVDENFSRVLRSRDIPTPEVKTLEELLNTDIVMMTIICDKVEFPGFHEGVDYIKKLDLPGYYDLNPAGVTKAIGVKKLMEHYGVPPHDCGFIGDGDNDTEIMDLSGLSFAVANAPDFVKKHAKWVMDKSYNEGAVAQALELVYGPF
ncbi:haloacid dehalogenase-like hydrolase family member protein [Theileria equi strain WA]|uniref:Haloacid dehalogenase-like hydrolase family member protein n=1 Tax=Theileria equi strain WA TaxID=1537102 RepID=L0AYI8_THEEQ|nr:haloacid dehalogenase-like hydrolase family member protein [Theileria equi strain WA]AFZ80318.1 haloacid dehalogenase-like hydrolase family member protein [Theileria equi strain WA]|eukprot:XP_004829984.1 haloacid dehalogenase-like hydrolase family member protein [Theileria equi strain WA]